MAKAKLQQIKLTSGNDAAQPPFPGGWVLAIFDALNAFAPALAASHRLPVGQRTADRIKAAEAVKQGSYDKIEGQLVALITELFPKVSAVNGFAQKYVDEYFRLWKQAAEASPHWAKCLGFEPGESAVLGRAFVRDLVLRLCYLESCERTLRKQDFDETELAFLRHDSPPQLYQILISERARDQHTSIEELAYRLKVAEKSLQRIKRGRKVPSLKLLVDLGKAEAGHRLLAGLGFVDQLLKTLDLHKSILRNEFLSIASVFLRCHPNALKTFAGSILRKTGRGTIVREACDFEHFTEYGDNLLLHPGFDSLWQEMPDALWRCHLYALRFGRDMDLAQAYLQFATEDSDARLEKFLREAEEESTGCPYRWMERLRLRKQDAAVVGRKNNVRTRRRAK